MPEPHSDDDWLVIEGYARWAGDTTFAREMLERVESPEVKQLQVTRERRGERVPNAVIQLAEIRKRRQKTTRRELEYEHGIEKPEPIEPQPEDRKPASPFIQSSSVRAVVAMVTQRELEMRGYPIDLNAVPQIIKRAMIAQRKYAYAGQIDRKTIGSENDEDVVKATGGKLGYAGPSASILLG